jgi:hypothetical protein
LNGEIHGVNAASHFRRTQKSLTKRSVARFLSHPDGATLLLGVVIGVGVCAPVLFGGRLFLLDWTAGPHVAIGSASALGLNGGLTTGIGGSLLVAVLNRLVGSASTWLPMFAFFPIATVGAGRLAGRSPWSRLAAASLYAVNPFVFNRLYVGHLTLLLGCALLPFAVKAAMRSFSSSRPRWIVPTLWWAGLTSLSPHFAWIYGLVILGVVVVAIVMRQEPLLRIAGWFVACTGAFALMSTYIILPNGSTTLPTQVGSVSLSLYQTNGDPHLGLFANVLALYGFWRTGPGPELPKDVIIGWPFIMFAILVIVGVGAWHGLRRQPNPNRELESSTISDREDPNPSIAFDERRLAILLVIVGVAGYFLALGSQGPTGALFTFAYNHVPFFSIMREPQKFLMLLALSYAVFFGWGVERLVRAYKLSSRLQSVSVAVLLSLILPLGYSATIFDGLAGQISSSPLPLAYQQADDLMGAGAGNVLVLPWHTYMEYPFTQGRVVANVGPTTFRRNVISGDNVQADDVQTQSTSPRSAFLEELFNVGENTREFGALVRPLGVQYIVLSKTVDWATYSYLNHQNDLKLVLDDSSLEVWRNTDYEGVGQRVTALKTASSISDLLQLAQSNEFGAGAVVTPGTAAGFPTSARAPSGGPGPGTEPTLKPSVHQISPVAYRVPAGAPGWVTIDATYQQGWTLNGRAAKPTAEGTVLVRVGSKGGTLVFTPWRLVRLGYIVSGGVFVALSLVLGFESRRRKKSLTTTVDFQTTK